MIQLTKRGLFSALAAVPFLTPMLAQAAPVRLVLDNGGAGLSLNALDRAIDDCAGARAIVMDKWMRNMLSAASRSVEVAGFVSWDLDEDGLRRAYYNDLPILVTQARRLGGEAHHTSVLVISEMQYPLARSEREISDATLASLRLHSSTVMLNRIAPLTPVR